MSRPAAPNDNALRDKMRSCARVYKAERAAAAMAMFEIGRRDTHETVGAAARNTDDMGRMIKEGERLVEAWKQMRRVAADHRLAAATRRELRK